MTAETVEQFATRIARQVDRHRAVVERVVREEIANGRIVVDRGCVVGLSASAEAELAVAFEDLRAL